jgi:hypothetical protein
LLFFNFFMILSCFSSLFVPDVFDVFGLSILRCLSVFYYVYKCIL